MSEPVLLITSPATPGYNCLAWAAGPSNGFFWTGKKGFYDWPNGLPRTEKTATILKFFEKQGFQLCQHDRTETGFEKIAIFEKAGMPTNACRLLKKGVCPSKIGALADVRHSFDALSGGDYGEAKFFMKRRTADNVPSPLPTVPQ